MLCINYKDELSGEGDALVKSFEVYKINYRSLCNVNIIILIFTLLDFFSLLLINSAHTIQY